MVKRLEAAMTGKSLLDVNNTECQTLYEKATTVAERLMAQVYRI